MSNLQERRRARADPVHVLSAEAALSALAIGVAAGGGVALLGAPVLWPITAWVVATLIVLTWVWRHIWPQDHEQTKRLAEAESRSRTTDTAVLVASITSLGAVAFALIQSGSRPQAGTTAVVGLSVLAAVLSWALVNTVFALKYARAYYLDQDGGIDFRQDEPPAYSDFAYLAFTVGMALAVPETEPTTTAIRKITLGHALLSYLFATGILAVAVNLISNLGHG